MAYFKIGSTDISNYVSSLKITRTANYTAQTNAAGDSVVDYINSKRKIEVELIPMVQSDFDTLSDLFTFAVTISYREPDTGSLTSGIGCICKQYPYEYYTIQNSKVMYKKLKLTFEEL